MLIRVSAHADMCQLTGAHWGRGHSVGARELATWGEGGGAKRTESYLAERGRMCVCSMVSFLSGSPVKRPVQHGVLFEENIGKKAEAFRAAEPAPSAPMEKLDAGERPCRGLSFLDRID